MSTNNNAAESAGQIEQVYTKVKLYGGAVTADLPNEFSDVSSIRDVPDNQEVFLHRTQLTSIVFDILERIQPPDHPCETDEDALLYHYNDVTEVGYVREGTEVEEETKVWETKKVNIPSLGPGVIVYSLFASQRPHSQPPAAANSGKPRIDFTGILFTMIRLEKQKTDFLISINVPHAQGEYDPEQLDFEALKPGPLLATAKQHHEKILQSFKIEDWSLFVQEKEV